MLYEVITKKGIAYFKFRGVDMVTKRTDISDAPTAEQAAELVNPLADKFVQGELDAIYIVHAEYQRNNFV